MATKKITFDPDAGVPYGANLSIYSGANFNANFNVVDTSNTAFDFTGWTGSSQMVKSVGAGSTTIAAATFTVGFTSAYDGKFHIGLTTTQTSELADGRYFYDVNAKTGTTVNRIVEGQIIVRGGISSTL